MKTQWISLFAMTAAMAALSATAATTTLRLDTRSGARPVAALEQIAYSSAWNDGAGGVVLTLDNAPLLTLGAPCSGVFAWDTADLDAGLHVLALDDGVERLTAEFSAEGDSFYTLAEALDAPNLVWTTDGEAPWYAVTAGTHDGVDAVRTGAIPETGDIGESRLRATFTGPGSLSFWWKLASSSYTSGIDLYVDGQDVDVWLIDETGWEQRTVALGEGSHVVEWNFWSDGSAPDDAAWLDQVTWTPGGGGVNTATQTTPEPVPYAWLDGFGLGDGTAAGYETAAKATARNGRPVWECYVAGLDPTDATDDFFATIEMVNGQPRISVGGRGERPGRVYTVEGKENLGDSWGPTNALSRFFHIKARVGD